MSGLLSGQKQCLPMTAGLQLLFTSFVVCCVLGSPSHWPGNVTVAPKWRTVSDCVVLALTELRRRFESAVNTATHIGGWMTLGNSLTSTGKTAACHLVHGFIPDGAASVSRQGWLHSARQFLQVGCMGSRPSRQARRRCPEGTHRERNAKLPVNRFGVQSPPRRPAQPFAERHACPPSA